tara:strand:+ start:19419 stop:19619 length:201 start_codon:yes stop_codon:yes gene_type:complete
MSERLNLCGECNMESLTRVPSIFASSTNNDKHPTENKPGELVKEFIEKSKEEIKIEKNNMTKEMKI